MKTLKNPQSILAVGAHLSFLLRGWSHLCRKKNIDISSSHSGHIIYLSDRESVRVQHIAGVLQISQQAAGKMNKELVKRGIVKITRCPDDGRARNITLTAKGRKAYALLEQHLTDSPPMEKPSWI